ncbi:glycosyltransferase, partial [Candidatus Woesearchaeota archaeon]|nr:glycosyltransferase [Candidatus Woesearchaeota archaeon]
MNKKIYLSIVIPFHNEEKSIPILCKRLESVLKKELKNNWEVILVNDSSEDNTLKIMKKIHNKNKNFIILDLEKRSGQT